MAKIAKMDRNGKIKQVFVLIMEKAEKWIQVFFMKIDYNFPYLDMNEKKKLIVGKGPRGPL